MAFFNPAVTEKVSSRGKYEGASGSEIFTLQRQLLRVILKCSQVIWGQQADRQAALEQHCCFAAKLPTLQDPVATFQQ